MFYQIWNIFKFRNPLQQANFCKHFTNVSNFPHLQKANKVVFLLGIKTQSQTISIKTTTIECFHSNFPKYQLSKPEIWIWSHCLKREFPKDYSQEISRSSIQGAQMMGSSLGWGLPRGATPGGLGWIFGEWHFGPQVTVVLKKRCKGCKWMMVPLHEKKMLMDVTWQNWDLFLKRCGNIWVIWDRVPIHWCKILGTCGRCRTWATFCQLHRSIYRPSAI